VGAVTLTNPDGDKFFENFNFRDGVAPIDYLYIYDQGGPDYTDDNMSKLLTLAVQLGMVRVAVYYNIQPFFTADGTKTGIVEGYNPAYAAINNFNYIGSPQVDKTLFDGYMKRYFTKMAKDFTLLNGVGIPVQVVMEPDFLSYMGQQYTPDASTGMSQFVPDTANRQNNTAVVSDIYAAGLLSAQTDPQFANTVTGLVQAINYYTGKNMPNLRIGWKTNLWGVPEQRNYSLGLLHMTDAVSYPWQGSWTGPAPTWAEGRSYIADQAAQLGAFLNKVGVTYWKGSPDRAPFLAIDKYGVDGNYTVDPQMLTDTPPTAAFSDLGFFISSTNVYRATLTDAQVVKYFGGDTGASCASDPNAVCTVADFTAFYNKYQQNYDKTAADVQGVFTSLQKAVVADPNLAKWFLNADQWSNYLYLVQGLSTALGGTQMMLWQIPQGHINGSTTLTGRDLPNVAVDPSCQPGALCGFEDSATSYFLGDSFTATGGRLAHFSANQAKDPKVTAVGDTVTWDQHMTDAGKSGAMSVLFGAGLGLSTRGTPTPGGAITDLNFWADKATAYLRSVNAG
jgi:hypothetical protein